MKLKDLKQTQEVLMTIVNGPQGIPIKLQKTI